MLLGTGGFGILLYLTALKLSGSAIGGRPLLLLGILLLVVGIQFFSIGLVGELLTSHHEEKAVATGLRRSYVRDSLR